MTAVEVAAAWVVLVVVASGAFRELVAHVRRYFKAEDRMLPQKGYCVMHCGGYVSDARRSCPTSRWNICAVHRSLAASIAIIAPL